MQNLTVNTNATSFRAHIDSKFLYAANAFYRENRSPAKYSQFRSAIRRFREIANSDSLTISYKKGFKDGKPSHLLYAKEEGKQQDILLAQKDQFRKLLEKFSYMNEYEFKIKTGLIKK